jgi:hypothetical protein
MPAAGTTQDENEVHIRVLTWWDDTEDNTGGIAKARCLRTLRGRRPCACMETSYAGTGRSHVCPKPRWPEAALGSLRTHASDERTWEVGQLHTTEKIAEQRFERVSGGGGGKGVGQGEPVGVKHAPDPVPGRRGKCARTGTPSGNGSFWRHYLRQEPGRGSAARRDLCGECGETRIPTATYTVPYTHS